MNAGEPTRVGDTWLFPDGTILPVVSGGSDTAPAPDPGGEAELEAAPEADAGEEAEPDFHALGEEASGLLAQEGDTIPVPRRVVERWNKEHQTYRERFQPYEQAFSAVPDADRETMLTWLSDMTSDDPAARSNAAQWMQQVISPHLPTPTAAEFDKGRPDGEQPDDDGFDPLDPKSVEDRVQKIVDERLSKAETERQIAEAHTALKAKARDLGYDPDAKPGDTARVDYQTLLLVAREQFPNDPNALDKAHELIENRLSDRATALLKKKAADADLPTAPQDGTAPSGRQAPKTLEDAEASMKETLAKVLDGSP